MRQDGDDTQLTVAAALLHHVLVDDLQGESVVKPVCKPATRQKPGVTDLHQLGGRGVIRKQIQGPGDDVTAGAPALVVFWLLPFAEDLDGGESSDLGQERDPVQFC